MIVTPQTCCRFGRCTMNRDLSGGGLQIADPVGFMNSPEQILCKWQLTLAEKQLQLRLSPSKGNDLYTSAFSHMHKRDLYIMRNLGKSLSASFRILNVLQVESAAPTLQDFSSKECGQAVSFFWTCFWCNFSDHEAMAGTS